MQMLTKRAVVVFLTLTLLASGGILLSDSILDSNSFHEPENAGAEVETTSKHDVWLDAADDCGLEEGAVEIQYDGNDSYFDETSAQRGLDYETTGDSTVEGTVTGVYATDYNGNYYPDLLLLGGVAPSLYCNAGGYYVEADALPEFDRDFRSALFFDHDNDGLDDLYLLSEEGSVFLENTGGEFSVRDVGLEVEFTGVRGAAAADYTGDGCLDVLVVQAGDWGESRPAGFNDRSVPITEDNGAPNRLFAGDCGSFVETTDDAGIEGEAWSLTTSFVDLTNDGYPDVHVANDFNNDILYLNEGDGAFDRRVLPEYTNRNGMSSEVADVTGNGFLDVFVTNIYEGPEDWGTSSYGVPGDGGSDDDDGSEVPEHHGSTDSTEDDIDEEDSRAMRFGGRTEGNNLLLNQGDGEFRDAAEEYGVRDSGGWGWAASFNDFDNDGDLDLFHTVDDDGQETVQRLWMRSGERFFEVPADRSGFGSYLARSMAVVDVEGDGGVDLALGVIRGSHRLYENRLERGNYLVVYVDGKEDFTSIGARVTVSYDDGELLRVKKSGSDYMSQSSRALHFGVGGSTDVDVEIELPDGETHSFEDVEVNSRIVVGSQGLEYLD